MKNKRNYKHGSIPTILLVSIVVAGMLVMSMPAIAADWPMYRNDASNTGNSSETINLPLTEQWHSSAPLVEENGAVVSNGIVYMSATTGQLYAFNVSTGSVISGFPVTTGTTYGSPAVDSVNQKVYALTFDGKLYAFNLDGTSAWTATVGSVGSNYNEGPIIDQGYVYIKAGGSLKKYTSGGVLQWSSATSGTSTQPSIMGDYVYVNSESGQIRKYNKATGTEVIGGGFPISTASDQAALTTVNGKIFYKANVLYAYSASDGSLVWSQPSGGDSTYYDSPAVSNGVVYVYGFDGKMYAFDENTGATMAGFPSVALNPVGGGSGRNWGTPAVAGNKIFIGAGTTQKLKVLGAAGDANAGMVLAEYPTFSADTQGFDLCSPIISDGVVFAMLDGGGLYAFFSSGIVWTGGAIIINDGAECTNSQVVTLQLDKGSNNLVNQMRISEDPLFSGAVWEPYSTTKTWTLSPGFGTKTVYVQFRDSNGQLSNVFNDKIEYSGTCGVVITGSISGMKFDDLNGNGMKDMGEPGLDNWMITLTNETGAVTTMMTDSDGKYNFSDLPDGDYTVGETLQTGWIQTAPAVSGTGSATYAVEISGGNIVADRDFGNFKLGSVHGMKFNDKNGNSMNDGEPGLEGWEITIDGFDTITDTPVHMVTMTDADGKYWFMDLTAGTYTISETMQNGWMQTAPTSGTYTVTIDTSGMVIEGLDFGNQRMPPEAECIETVNPAGNNIPTAGDNPSSGQNPDGFYMLLAMDILDPSPVVFVKDTGSGTIFGPFANGTRIKYTESNSEPVSKAIGGPDSAVNWHVKGNGDAAVYAMNNAGVNSTEVSCLVPPPPK